jgi:hypothetical protein
MSEPVQIQAERGEDYDIILPDGKSLFISVLGEAVVVLAYNADGSARGESLHLRLDDPDEDTSDPDSTAPNPDRWTCWDASGVRVSYDFNAAEEAAFAYVYDGDYAMPGIGEWTSFIEVSVAETADGEDARGETIHVPLYPGSPDCNGMAGDGDADDDGHIWHRVSTYGDGAGVYVTEVCGWCGLLKDTRTRPTCRDCGETLNTEAIRYRREE